MPFASGNISLNGEFVHFTIFCIIYCNVHNMLTALYNNIYVLFQGGAQGVILVTFVVAATDYTRLGEIGRPLMAHVTIKEVTL